MTALTLTAARSAPTRSARLAALARVEARRTLRSPWVWTGVAAGLAIVLATGDIDYQSESYVTATMGITPLALAAFVHGVQVGGRDHTGPSVEPVAAGAAMDADERATARLLGLWPVVALGVVVAVALGVGERIEGGFWLGEGAWRTDTRVHSVLELTQLPAVVLVAASAGMAAGRATRRRSLVSVLGAVAAAAFGFVWWAWQWVPARYVALLQTQPLELDLGPGYVVSDTPQGWLLAGPNEFDPAWRRIVVDEAMAGWHSAYLVGMAVLLAGLAVRGRVGTRLVGIGVLLAAVGVAAQVLVAPVAPGA